MVDPFSFFFLQILLLRERKQETQSSNSELRFPFVFLLIEAKETVKTLATYTAELRQKREKKRRGLQL